MHFKETSYGKTFNLPPTINSQVTVFFYGLKCFGINIFALQRLLYCPRFFEDRMFLRYFPFTYLFIYSPDTVIIIKFVVLGFEMKF